MQENGRVTGENKGLALRVGQCNIYPPELPVGLYLHLSCSAVVNSRLLHVSVTNLAGSCTCMLINVFCYKHKSFYPSFSSSTAPQWLAASTKVSVAQVKEIWTFLPTPLHTRKSCFCEHAFKMWTDRRCQWTNCTLESYVAINGRTNPHVCLCSAQPQTEVRTHQKLQLFLLFPSSLFAFSCRLCTFMKQIHKAMG